MLKPIALLGHIIPSSSHVASIVSTSGPMTSGMFLLSFSQVGNIFTQGQTCIPATRPAHMLTPTIFLGHIICSSSHIANNVATLGPMTSGMFLLSSSQANNTLAVTQSAQPIPMTIQVGIASVLLSKGGNSAMGKLSSWEKP